MADVTRRRKVRSSVDSEKLSEDSYEENDVVKGSEEEGELNVSTEGTRESEYETVEGDTETDDSAAIDNEDEDDDSVIIEYEREDGDGQSLVVIPGGTIAFISKCYKGKASDTYITNNCGFLNLLGKNDVVLVDKGFPGIKAKSNSMIAMPSFLHNGRFSYEGIMETQIIASVRESAPPKEKKLDDDEDRRNPQYIPKRGTFYEHDDRTAVEDVGGNETSEKEAAERAAKEGQVNERTKKVWREHENRWSHDRYNEDEQAPKSREELIAIYGYDIRNEEGPPRARRRRRYGRGPNKYTRNWEDEDAYSKPQIAISSSRGGGRQGGRRGGGRQSNHIESQEEFPPLKNSAQSDNENSNNSINQNVPVQGTTYSNRTIGIKRNTKEDRNVKTQKDAFPPLESESQQSRTSNAREPATNKTHSSNYKNNKEESSIANTNPSLSRKIRDGPHAEAGRGVGRGRSKSNRGRGGATGMFDGGVGIAVKTKAATRSSSETRMPAGVTQHHESNKGTSNSTAPSAHPIPNSTYHSGNKISQEEPTREFHRRNNKGNSGNHSQQSSVQQGMTVASDRRQQAVVPPRMQQQQQQQQDSSSGNRPKRYSSLRQRSLPETGASYQPPTYYQAGTDLESVDTSSNRPKRYSSIHQVPGAVYSQPDPSSTYFQPAGYVPPQPVYGDTPQHPQSTGTPPLQLLAPHPGAAAYAATFPSTTTQFVGPPPPRMLPPAAGAPPGYIPAPAPAPSIINYVPTPPTYTTFPGYTAVPPPPPPAELYHPQAGITYYNTEEQTIVPRPITQKRQRSAIPIVPPPERAPKGRGRSANSREETPIGDNTQPIEDLSVVNPVPPSPPVTNFEDAEPVPTNESLTSAATVA